MSIVRYLRKRLVRQPARAPEITVVFNQYLGRLPTRDEIVIWERKWISLKRLKHRIAMSPEGRSVAQASASKERVTATKRVVEIVQEPALPPLLKALSEEDFVRTLYEHILGRHPSPAELHAVASQLRSGGVRRHDLITSYLAGRITEALSWAEDETVNDISRFGIMGTSGWMTVKDWRARAESAAGNVSAGSRHARFPLRPRASEVDVSVICSLWRGGDFIERYLENITSQSIFADRCELIVIDAASPEGEGEVVARYAERFGHRIVYHRMPYRAGIYVAWNVGVGLARGHYLTNANLDDLRRADSLELQASTLDALSYVDVVYQDFLYSADPGADFATIAGAGVASDLPLPTRNGLFKMNPPHNAPMWRAALHDRIGLFDEKLSSAGDYDFWIRAMNEGATFYKINDPHVVYYYNPNGISSSRQTTGITEGREVLRRHGRALMPKATSESPDAFLRRLDFDRWPTRSDGIPLSRYEAVQARMRQSAAAHGSPRRGSRA